MIKIKVEEHICIKVFVNQLVTNFRKKHWLGFHRINHAWLNDPTE
jgi:hypothetical protein